MKSYDIYAVFSFLFCCVVVPRWFPWPWFRFFISSLGLLPLAALAIGRFIVWRRALCSFLVRPSPILWKDPFFSAHTHLSGFVFGRLTNFFYVIHIVGS